MNHESAPGISPSAAGHSEQLRVAKSLLGFYLALAAYHLARGGFAVAEMPGLRERWAGVAFCCSPLVKAERSVFTSAISGLLCALFTAILLRTTKQKKTSDYTNTPLAVAWIFLFLFTLLNFPGCL